MTRPISEAERAALLACHAALNAAASFGEFPGGSAVRKAAQALLALADGDAPPEGGAWSLAPSARLAPACASILFPALPPAAFDVLRSLADAHGVEFRWTTFTIRDDGATSELYLGPGTMHARIRWACDVLSPDMTPGTNAGESPRAVTLHALRRLLSDSLEVAALRRAQAKDAPGLDERRDLAAAVRRLGALSSAIVAALPRLEETWA